MGEPIGEERATERARSWLVSNDFPLERRTVVCTPIDKAYQVVFSVPPDTLGGDFTLVIDAISGEIIDKRFER